VTEPDLFPTLRVADVTNQHMLDEISRELKMRRRVYPRLVAQGKLAGPTADLRIKILLAIQKVIQERPLEGS